MKKTLLYIVAVTFFIAGCTSKEQDEQINSFWQEQLAKVFSGRQAMRPPQDPHMTPENLLLDKDGKPIFPPEANPQEQPAQPPAPQAPSVNAPEAAAQPGTTAAPLPNRAPIKAVLFIHSDSPVCKRLKAENWDKNFLEKYQGRVFLVEYDMKNPDSKAPLQEMMRKYKLSTITVPILFIGDQSVQGYPFNGIDQAVQKALTAPAQAQQRATKRKQQSNQYMEIIMEDAPKTPKKNTRASARDSRAIQLALASVEKNNQATLADMGSFFGEDTKAQAYLIISRTERLLRNKAASSPDYKTYLATQKSLLQIQEKELNELMRQNAKNLRSTRG